MAGGLRVTCTDGTVHEARVAGQRGSMHQPLSRDELEDKFRRLAEGRADADAIIRFVRSLHGAGGLDDLQEALA